VRPETVLRLQRHRRRHHLIDRPHLAVPVRSVRVPEEQVRRERHSVPQPAAQDLRHRHAPPLPQDVQTRELDCRQHLRSVVVQRRRRVRDQEPQLLQPRWIAAQQVRLQPLERRHRHLAAATHLAQPDQTLVRLHLHDRPHEPPPVAAVRVPQRRLERHGHWRRADVLDLHVRGVGRSNGGEADKFTLSVSIMLRLVSRCQGRRRTRANDHAILALALALDLTLIRSRHARAGRHPQEITRR
jgi:hypothetical protein